MQHGSHIQSSDGLIKLITYIDQPGDNWRSDNR